MIQRNSLIVGGLILIAVVFGYFFLWPSYQHWSAQRRELAQLQAELNSLSQKSTLIKQLEAAEPTLGLQSQKAAALIPTEEERESFIGELDALAQANRLVLGTLNVTQAVAAKKSVQSLAASKAAIGKPSKSTDKTKSVSYQATVTGSFPDVQHFLAELDRSKRLTLIQTFDIAASSQVPAAATAAATPAAAPGVPQVGLSFVGSIYTKSAPKVSENLKFTADRWQYLTDRELPVPEIPATTGRVDPFAAY